MCSLAQLWLTLCHPMDCSLPDSSDCGVSQARILEWVATSYSRGYSRPEDWTCISCISYFGWQILDLSRKNQEVMADGFFTTVPPGKPCRGMCRAQNGHRERDVPGQTSHLPSESAHSPTFRCCWRVLTYSLVAFDAAPYW